MTVERQDFRLNDSILQSDNGVFRTIRNFNGSDYIAHPYMQWQRRVNQKLRFNAGISSNYQNSTGSISVEPRAGINWEPVMGSTFSLAYGLHSLPTPVEVLQSKILDVDGNQINPNTDLGFTKSHQLECQN